MLYLPLQWESKRERWEIPTVSCQAHLSKRLTACRGLSRPFVCVGLTFKGSREFNPDATGGRRARQDLHPLLLSEEAEASNQLPRRLREVVEAVER